ncbi:hypothetical protein T440DRAFT_183669 [Plenodomus tracheiphilus IPT5]|uniref:Uncharacterized protein n=1 Tax=Plenodomus tracheiphilus IPT5 TaxID=1408161 RepID=A0A6A7AX57_9PLEO|nr:hypothetical protein T440DRAFT_183669 [Plenodomus tracheiphilus IPT5]
MTDEILAHISAPTTRQTDRLYQSLADAYHTFAPRRAQRDRDQDQTGSWQARPSGAPLKASATARDDSLDIVATSIIASSKDSFGSFPSYLSSEDRVNPFTLDASPVDGDSTEYGSIQTSSRLVRLEHLHQNWKEKTTLKSSFAKNFRSSQRTSQVPDDDDADTAFIENTQLAMQALQSQLEDSRSINSEDDSTSETDSEEYTGNFQVSDVPEDTNDVITNEVKDPSSPAQVAEPDINTVVAKRPSRPVEASISPTSSSCNGDGKMQFVVHATLPTEFFDFSKLPLNIFPPAPQISVSKPGGLPSQITSYLASVKRRHPNRYNLVRRKYKPKDDDRGYWAVNCTSWPVKAQLGIWSSLQDYLVNGELGWGITIHRDPKSSDELGEIRLYCWAEVAEHMWLQLWLSSGGYISFLNWLDANGHVTLQAKLKPKASGAGIGSES